MAKKEPKLIKMQSTANCPQMVPGIGEVGINGTFEVSIEQADELSKGLFKKIEAK